mgnify:FL=1
MGDSRNPGGSTDLQCSIFCAVVPGTCIDSDCGRTVFGETVPRLAQLVT